MPKLTIKHISSLAFALPHLSNTTGIRASRLLLASLPAKASPKHPVVPQIAVTTVDGPAWIEATYSDKSKIKYDVTPGLKYDDLFRQVGLVERGGQSHAVSLRFLLRRILTRLADRGTSSSAEKQRRRNLIGVGHRERFQSAFSPQYRPSHSSVPTSGAICHQLYKYTIETRITSHPPRLRHQSKSHARSHWQTLWIIH